MDIKGLKTHRTVQGMIEDIEVELADWKRTRDGLKRMGRDLCQDSLKVVVGLMSRLERLQKLPRDQWIPRDF